MAATQLEKPMLIDVDDEDDDIMLIEEEGVSEGNACQTASKNTVISDINDHIKEMKTVIEQTEGEIKTMRQSLCSMEPDMDEAVYEKLKFLVDTPASLVHLPFDHGGLEGLIKEVVEEMFTPDLADFSRHENQVITKRLNSIENKNRVKMWIVVKTSSGANQAVSKMFLECHGKLKALGQSLAEESTRVNDEIAHYEKILAERTTINIDDDDDDDVKIVDDPIRNSTVPSSPLSQVPGANSQMNLTQLRSQFANAVQSQMSGLLNTLNSQQEQAVPKVTSTLSSDKTSGVASENNSTTALAALLARTEGDKPFVWPTIEVNDKVLGKKFNDVWYPGVVLDVYPPAPPKEPEWRCKVRFNKGMKVLPGKHVAYKDSLKCMVRVGTRVTALYKEEDSPSTMYAGIIAEAPSTKNNKRFLVFFDDGYAQYCQAMEVHKVYMQSENVWEDIHPDTRSFIKDYLDIYPERPMVRLAKGQVVKTEWNGKWWTAKVLELDASLVKMVFQADRRTEWIYRGSTRLEPLFRALTNANAIKAAGSSRGRRLNLTMKPSDANRRPAVEYTRGGGMDDESSRNRVDHSKAGSSKTPVSSSVTSSKSENKKKMNVARKSTGGTVNPGIQGTQGAKVPTAGWEAPWLKYQRKASSLTTTATTTTILSSSSSSSSSVSDQRQNEFGGQEKVGSSKGQQAKQMSTYDIASVLQERLAHTADQVEYDESTETGKRRDIAIDTKGKSRAQFVPHNCGPECLGDMEEVLDDAQKMKSMSPLLIPLLCLWERHICKARPTPKRNVIYRGPCGRRLRSIEEVDKYLMLTNSQLGIDLFSFDHNLHVTREFVPIKTFCDIKDLSYGIENYPISCVNGVDRHYPDYVEYYNYRIPAKGVNLNLDPNFLACCDCTDNCRDRSKCACQQQTIRNTSCVGIVDPDAGYEYRRLREPLFTGIYECNSRCPCDKRCHNKVAQLGLRMRLQVFRTEKKGWGLRCLDDIAKGSFICIYAGQLLTDRGANEDGKQYGDEYLAELDFMEVVEGQKEGYESDVEFSDDDKDKDSASKESDDSDFCTSTSLRDVGNRRRTSRKAKDKDLDKDVSKEKPKTESVADAKDSSMASPISISDEDDDNDDNENDGAKGKQSTTTEAKEDSSLNTSQSTEVRRRAKKSTSGSRLNLSYSSVHKSSEPLREERGHSKQKRTERLPTRSYFKDDTECYIMDAKSMGNLGRYLNHGCSPNVFVQNIFVDTHDLRFPWVAFFAGEYIRSGTELTWDYNYEVGSVPDKILYCYCGSSMCRGRLL